MHGSGAPNVRSGRVASLDPASAVHVMENHDRAYGLWREAGVRERVLVHVDAHHDMSWMVDDGSLSIANFICPALKEGVVREVYWVVPDRTWESRFGRAALRRHVRDIQAGYPGDASTVRWEEQRIRLAVLGRSLVICSLQSLPHLAEPVLLDVDTDYLLIPQVSYGEWDTHSPLPWRWPDELVASLRARGLNASPVTVAYSVEGGHTPLQWKYLGAELTFRLQCPDDSDGTEPYERMREGVVAQHSGDHSRAETAFHAVGARLGAAPYFWLGHLLASQGRIEEGRDCYKRALALDPSYASASTTAGAPLYFARAFNAAQRTFRRALLLDPEDAYAHVGLGWLAAKGKDWAHAERRARIAVNAVLMDRLTVVLFIRELNHRYHEVLRLRGHHPVARATPAVVGGRMRPAARVSLIPRITHGIGRPGAP